MRLLSVGSKAAAGHILRRGLVRPGVLTSCTVRVFREFARLSVCVLTGFSGVLACDHMLFWRGFCITFVQALCGFAWDDPGSPEVI